MNFIGRVIMSNIITKVINDLYQNRHKISQIKIRKKKEPLARIIDKIEASQVIHIDYSVYTLRSINIETGALYLKNSEAPAEDPILYDLFDPNDLQILLDAKYYKLVEIKD